MTNNYSRAISDGMFPEARIVLVDMYYVYVCSVLADYLAGEFS